LTVLLRVLPLLLRATAVLLMLVATGRVLLALPSPRLSLLPLPPSFWRWVVATAAIVPHETRIG
jgi:hypothetical protein